MLNFDIKLDNRVFEHTDDGIKLRISEDETNRLRIVLNKLTITEEDDIPVEIVPETLSFTDNGKLNNHCLISQIIEKGE